MDPLNEHPNLPEQIQTLQKLSLTGSWSTILTTTTPTTPNPPNPNPTLLTYHIISLTKLRRYSEALSTLESTLPSLPTLPFSLRWLHALLPSFINRRSDSLDRLYLLLSFVKGKERSRSWLRREKIVVGSLISLHCLNKEFSVCVEFLRRLIYQDSQNVDLLSRLGYVQLQFGDLDGAKACFDRVEVIVNEPEKPFTSPNDSQLVNLDGEKFVNEAETARNRQLMNLDGETIVNEAEKGKDIQLMNVDGETIVNEAEKPENRQLMNLDGETEVNEAEKRKNRRLNLIGRNRALVCLVGKDYVSAVREYDECISRDETDIVSINNKALCLMYLRDLSDSIKVIENSLERIPTVALNETVIVNLCSMYELAYVNHTDIKKTLSNWIARLAPDDFDSSCTRV